jgi:hypothetical protein
MSCNCEGQKCKMTLDDRRHGTNNGYQNLFCRCELCRSAHAEYYYSGAGKELVKRYREKQIERGLVTSAVTKRVRQYSSRDNAKGRRKTRTHSEVSDATTK